MGKILIASTSLHLIDSLIIKQRSNEDFHIVYIGKNSGFFDIVKDEFASCLYLSEKKDKNKIKRRIENAKTLIGYVKKLKPSEIITGNDRKIETAVLIKNYECEYSYMDDGLHSYIPEKQHIFKYTFLERKLKEAIYKNRLVLPKYIGAGEYIKKAYLFKPEFANTYLKNKKLIKLVPDREYLFSVFKRLVNPDIQEKLKKAKKVVFLPHHKFIDKKMVNKIERLIDENTFVKKHPRDNITDIKGKVIPNEIFSEAVFVFLNPDCEVYGYNTTAILTGRWLREDLKIYEIGSQSEIMKKNLIEYKEL